MRDCFKEIIKVWKSSPVVRKASKNLILKGYFMKVPYLPLIHVTEIYEAVIFAIKIGPQKLISLL
jgi:hypothetical protein